MRDRIGWLTSEAANEAALDWHRRWGLLMVAMTIGAWLVVALLVWLLV